MTGIFDWSKTAAANASADSEINWSEGQPRNTINDSARVMMRRVRQFLDDTQGALVTAGGAGTPNAYTVTTQSQITAYRTGVGFLVRIHQANTEAATLAVDGLAAKPWRDESGANFQAGDLALDNFLPVYYHAGSRTRCAAKSTPPDRTRTAAASWNTPIPRRSRCVPWRTGIYASTASPSGFQSAA
jgi:hypothetical protein